MKNKKDPYKKTKTVFTLNLDTVQLEKLAKMKVEKKKSLALMIREAVDQYIEYCDAGLDNIETEDASEAGFED